MNLVPTSLSNVVIGQALPCPLYDERGNLLARRGYRVTSREELSVIVGGRSEVYIDFDGSDEVRRSYVNRLNNLVMEDRELGAIADTQLSTFDASYGVDGPGDNASDADWLAIQERTSVVLRDPRDPEFLPRLQRLRERLVRHVRDNADGCLFALIQLANTELRSYSATHALLCAVMVEITAREVLKWPDDTVLALVGAALSMNVSMTSLQDRLAAQSGPLLPEQQRLVASHPARSVDLLQEVGVDDRLWLEAVLHHHDKAPGPLGDKPPGQRLARILQRADMFGAQMAPRTGRKPRMPSQAMQSCYFDENRQIDQAGAALIKAVGIYCPGTYVRLATQEIAVVVRRGANTTMPKVAVLVNRQGMPTGEPILRDTSLQDYKISAGLPAHEVRIRSQMQRLLALTRPSAADRPW